MLPPWSTDTIYQIFPLSYCDSNGDGKGDLQGIIQKLDYIASLGVNTIWLNPIYLSSWIDAGYDILNHAEIDPIFGTMRDLDSLITQAHRRKLKVMLDFLPNHTSDQHQWFVDSSSSRTHPKRDWYTWHDPAPDGGPPNNWKAVFGGSAWTFDATTQQYYLHTFYAQQPDLNLSNPHVRQAIYSIIRFYLNRGVDCFRLDAASHFAKDAQLRDNPLRKDWQQVDDPYEQQQHLYDKNLKERYEFINELSHQLNEYPKSYIITESYLNLTQLTELHKKTNGHNHTACNFYLMESDLQPTSIAKWINSYLTICYKQSAVPTWILSNHDRTRLASRFGHRAARLLAMLQLTLPGIAFIYYGDELGMQETNIPESLRHDIYEFHNRDAQRTPMQWSADINAGFSKTKPWLPVHPNFPIVNVVTEDAQPESALNFYRELLKIRHLMGSNFSTRLQVTDHVIHYQREQHAVSLNLSNHEVTIDLSGTVVLSTYMDQKGGEAPTVLRPYEGIILLTTIPTQTQSPASGYTSPTDQT